MRVRNLSRAIARSCISDVKEYSQNHPTQTFALLKPEVTLEMPRLDPHLPSPSTRQKPEETLEMSRLDSHSPSPSTHQKRVALHYLLSLAVAYELQPTQLLLVQPPMWRSCS